MRVRALPYSSCVCVCLRSHTQPPHPGPQWTPHPLAFSQNVIKHCIFCKNHLTKLRIVNNTLYAMHSASYKQYPGYTENLSIPDHNHWLTIDAKPNLL